jgi:predicted lactoylglutathione lyase
MNKIELWANFTHPAIQEMVKLFEERGYEVNKIYSASSTPCLMTDTKLFYTGYGNIISSFGLFKKK